MDFSAEASNWDTERRMNRARIIANEILGSVPVKDHFHALEFGCGTGLVSFNLIDKFEHITLVDSSEGMIEELKRKIDDAGALNLTAVCTDISTGSKLEGKFDIIYTSMALHHIVDIRTVLKKLYGMLKNEGFLCIVELNEDDGSFHKSEKDFAGHNGFDQKALAALLEELGYTAVSSNTFYNDYKIIYDIKINYSLFLMAGRKLSTDKP